MPQIIAPDISVAGPISEASLFTWLDTAWLRALTLTLLPATIDLGQRSRSLRRQLAKEKGGPIIDRPAFLGVWW